MNEEIVDALNDIAANLTEINYTLTKILEHLEGGKGDDD